MTIVNPYLKNKNKTHSSPVGGPPTIVRPPPSHSHSSGSSNNARGGTTSHRTDSSSVVRTGRMETTRNNNNNAMPLPPQTVTPHHKYTSKTEIPSSLTSTTTSTPPITTTTTIAHKRNQPGVAAAATSAAAATTITASLVTPAKSVVISSNETPTPSVVKPAILNDGQKKEMGTNNNLPTPSSLAPPMRKPVTLSTPKGTSSSSSSTTMSLKQKLKQEITMLKKQKQLQRLQREAEERRRQVHIQNEMKEKLRQQMVLQQEMERKEKLLQKERLLAMKLHEQNQKRIEREKKQHEKQQELERKKYEREQERARREDERKRREEERNRKEELKWQLEQKRVEDKYQYDVQVWKIQHQRWVQLQQQRQIQVQQQQQLNQQLYPSWQQTRGGHPYPPQHYGGQLHHHHLHQNHHVLPSVPVTVTVTAPNQVDPVPDGVVSTSHHTASQIQSSSSSSLTSAHAGVPFSSLSSSDPSPDNIQSTTTPSTAETIQTEVQGSADHHDDHHSNHHNDSTTLSSKSPAAERTFGHDDDCTHSASMNGLKKENQNLVSPDGVFSGSPQTKTTTTTTNTTTSMTMVSSEPFPESVSSMASTTTLTAPQQQQQQPTQSLVPLQHQPNNSFYNNPFIPAYPLGNHHNMDNSNDRRMTMMMTMVPPRVNHNPSYGWGMMNNNNDNNNNYFYPQFGPNNIMGGGFFSNCWMTPPPPPPPPPPPAEYWKNLFESRRRRRQAVTLGRPKSTTTTTTSAGGGGAGAAIVPARLCEALVPPSPFATQARLLVTVILVRNTETEPSFGVNLQLHKVSALVDPEWVDEQERKQRQNSRGTILELQEGKNTASRTTPPTQPPSEKAVDVVVGAHATDVTSQNTTLGKDMTMVPKVVVDGFDPVNLTQSTNIGEDTLMSSSCSGTDSKPTASAVSQPTVSETPISRQAPISNKVSILSDEQRSEAGETLSPVPSKDGTTLELSRSSPSSTAECDGPDHHDPTGLDSSTPKQDQTQDVDMSNKNDHGDTTNNDDDIVTNESPRSTDEDVPAHPGSSSNTGTTRQETAPSSEPRATSDAPPGQMEQPSRRKRRRRVNFGVMLVVDAEKQNTRRPNVVSDELLQPGDIIISIGGQHVAGMTFTDACKIFSEKSEKVAPTQVQTKLTIARKKLVVAPPPSAVLPMPTISKEHGMKQPTTTSSSADVKLTKPAPTPLVVHSENTSMIFTTVEVALLADCVQKSLFSPNRALGTSIPDSVWQQNCSVFGMAPNLANSSISYRKVGTLQNKWLELSRTMDYRIAERGRKFWEKRLRQDCGGEDPPFASDAERSGMRHLPRPPDGKGCRCKRTDHQYVFDPKCTLYRDLRKRLPPEEIEDLVQQPKKVVGKGASGTSNNSKDLSAVESAFKNRILKLKESTENESIEARFVAKMEEIQVKELKKAIFAPNLTSMVLSTVFELQREFHTKPEEDTDAIRNFDNDDVDDVEEEVDDGDEDDDNVPLIDLGKRKPSDEPKGRNDGKKQRVQLETRQTRVDMKYLIRMLDYLSRTWGHCYREPSNEDYAWRWEVFHGHNSENGQWESQSKTPRVPYSLTFENIRFGLLASKSIKDEVSSLPHKIKAYEDSVISGAKPVKSLEGNNSLSDESKNTDSLMLDISSESLEQLCLTLHLVSPAGSGLSDELSSLVQSNILEMRSGIPVVTQDWWTKVDILVLDDMDASWSTTADPDGRYCINEELRDTLEEKWVKSDFGWALTDDRKELIFEFAVLDEWREAFEGRLEEEANDMEGIGRFGL